MRQALPLLLLAAFVGAQETQGAKYENPEMGLQFAGVYGWDRQEPEGTGAWNKLVSYRNEAYDADVLLLVRPNPFESTPDLKKGLEEEFKTGGEPTDGKPVFKEATFQDAAMRDGNQLPAIEVEAIQLRVSEGKKREYQLLVRTYLGANRLFRVYCIAPRARAKRVRDLFDRAVAGLTVTGSEERVVTGIEFRSDRGQYACLIPETFEPTLPEDGRKMDMIFTSRRLGVTVTIYSYGFRGDARDHVDELLEFYGDDFKPDEKETKLFGGEGFRGTLNRDKAVTLIAGAVRNERLYRIHTSAAPGNAARAREAEERFLKSFRVGG